MTKRYIPSDGTAKKIDEVGGTVTISADALGVEDLRDYMVVGQIEAGGASAIVVNARGPRGNLVVHTASVVDNQIVFFSADKFEFYDMFTVVFTGSTNAAVHVWLEERGR